MTDKVHVSFGRTYRSREAAAVRGFALADVIIPSSTRLVEDSEGELATGAVNAFNYVSASALDVTIDTGEAVVGGAYLARDAQSTVTVTDNTTTTIYVGWKDSQADTVIVGTSGDFTSDDPKVAIWDITASGGSVTGQTDQRNLDEYRVPASKVDPSLVPAGLIAIWSGSVASIPNGYVLCDGLNSTPNLQDKFIVGAGSTYAVDDIGGESTHVLTKAELPSHDHSYTDSQNKSGWEGDYDSSVWYGTSGNTTGTVGSDSAHENKPPYHALAYIMKT